MPHESFRVLVVDAATTVGRALVGYLAETEYEVRALVTDAADEHWAIHAGADDVVVADLTSTPDLEDVVADVDAICCSVHDGGWKYLFGVLDAGVGLRSLIDAAADSTPYVVLHSRIGVGDSSPGMVLPLRILTYRVRTALDATERYLRETGLPHTILRTGSVTRGDPTGSTTDDPADPGETTGNGAEVSEEPRRDGETDSGRDDADSAINHLGNDDFTIDLEDVLDPEATSDADDRRTGDGTDHTTTHPGERDARRRSDDAADSGRLADVVDPRHAHDVVTATGGDTVSGRISRSDLAWLMAAALTTPEARNRTFEVVDATAATSTDGVDFRWRGPETGLVARRSGYSIPS